MRQPLGSVRRIVTCVLVLTSWTCSPSSPATPTSPTPPVTSGGCPPPPPTPTLYPPAQPPFSVSFDREPTWVGDDGPARGPHLYSAVWSVNVDATGQLF